MYKYIWHEEYTPGAVRLAANVTVRHFLYSTCTSQYKKVQSTRSHCPFLCQFSASKNMPTVFSIMFELCLLWYSFHSYSYCWVWLIETLLNHVIFANTSYRFYPETAVLLWFFGSTLVFSSCTLGNITIHDTTMVLYCIEPNSQWVYTYKPWRHSFVLLRRKFRKT